MSPVHHDSMDPLCQSGGDGHALKLPIRVPVCWDQLASPAPPRKLFRNFSLEARWSCRSFQKGSVDYQDHASNSEQDRHKQGRTAQHELNAERMDLDPGIKESFFGVDISGRYCYGTSKDNPDSLKLTFEPSYRARSASPCICLGSGPTSEIGREELDGRAPVRGFGMFMQNTEREK